MSSPLGDSWAPLFFQRKLSSEDKLFPTETHEGGHRAQETQTSNFPPASQAYEIALPLSGAVGPISSLSHYASDCRVTMSSIQRLFCMVLCGAREGGKLILQPYPGAMGEIIPTRVLGKFL